MSKAMQIAQREYRRLIADGMGIFRIAEAWGIQPMKIGREKNVRADVVRSALPEWMRGRGVLTEPYLLAEMAKQIAETIPIYVELSLQRQRVSNDYLYF